MTSFRHLSRAVVLDLAHALESGRLAPPFTEVGVGRYVPSGARAETLEALQALGEMPPEQTAKVLRLVADERAAAQAVGDRADLVWTGPEREGAQSRSTATVARELFAKAEESVLVASYALDSPHKVRAIFQPLADRMAERPGLRVRLFVNVPRKWRNEDAEAILLRQFADNFRQGWPGDTMPEVFHDPRALEIGGHSRACLHAKCVVVDDEHVLISSANFTEAAHERNIEAGVVLHDPSIAVALREQFENLVRVGALVRVPGIG